MTDQFTQTEENLPALKSASEHSQLYQIRVPLDEATNAFNTRDVAGRFPIVVISERPNRINNELVWVGLGIIAAAILASILLNTWTWTNIGTPAGILFIVLGLYRSFILRVPEGANALLARGGRYVRTISSGTHILPPWILVTHLVTRRQIPFDAPVLEMPTADDVRADVDMLVTFTITDPYRFVYSISADDFDQVFLATCQDALRAMLRQIASDEVFDLNINQAKELAGAINADMESYGVTINKVNITYAGAPKEFMQSKEAQRLAILQRLEQQEKQTLALQRQADEDELARQREIARVTRERETLQLQVQAAEMRKRIVELEAQAEELRLDKLEERLKKYPVAAQWDVESAQMDIARSLAGNTRAVVQVGKGGEIAQAFMLGEILHGDNPLSDTPRQQVAPKRSSNKT